MVAVCRKEWLPAMHVLACSGYVMAMCRVCGCYVHGYVVAMWLLCAWVCGCYVHGYVVAMCMGMWSLMCMGYVVAMCRHM